VVLAPELGHSYAGHRVTTDQPLRLTPTSPGAFHLSGTPADCIRAAVCSDFSPARFDWVLSGINRGGNLGADIYSSGTVAAAREGALLGLPSIAISQYLRRDLKLDWEASAGLARRVIEQLVAKGCPPGSYYNVNLPHLEDPAAAPGPVVCQPDHAPLDVRFTREGDLFHFSGRYADRQRTPGRDVETCFGGAITLSRLEL
jgi:5'-nucleotidase